MWLLVLALIVGAGEHARGGHGWPILRRGGRAGPASHVIYVDRESELVVASAAGQSRGDAKPRATGLADCWVPSDAHTHHESLSGHAYKVGRGDWFMSRRRTDRPPQDCVGVRAPARPVH